MPTPSDPVTRWSALGTISSILSEYEPGFKEVTNLGLLFTRAFLAYDGVTQTQNISPSSEKNTLYTMYKGYFCFSNGCNDAPSDKISYH